MFLKKLFKSFHKNSRAPKRQLETQNLPPMEGGRERTDDLVPPAYFDAGRRQAIATSLSHLGSINVRNIEPIE